MQATVTGALGESVRTSAVPQGTLLTAGWYPPKARDRAGWGSFSRGQTEETACVGDGCGAKVDNV